MFLRPLLTALRFLTRLPIPGDHEPGEGELARGMALHPLVGALIGGLIGALGVVLLLFTGLPPGGVAVILAMFGPLLTGGLHEDGLADTFDGLGGGHDRARALEIMRDSRIGTYGALALVGAVLLRATLLHALLVDPSSPGGAAEPARWLPALVVAHSVGRLIPVILVRILPYARAGEGLARPMVDGVTRGHVLAALAQAAVIALLVGGGRGAGSLAAALVQGLLAGAWFRRRVGGITGDLAGATVVITELLVLAVFTLE